MVLTVSFALSPGTGLSCPRRRAKPGFAQLDTSVGVSGPHDFAVRVGTGRLMRTRAPRRHRVHRIPRSTYRDDRPKRPQRGGIARMMLLISGKVKFVSENQKRPDATEWHDGQFAHGAHAGNCLSGQPSAPVTQRRCASTGHAVFRPPPMSLAATGRPRPAGAPVYRASARRWSSSRTASPRRASRPPSTPDGNRRW